MASRTILLSESAGNYGGSFTAYYQRSSLLGEMRFGERLRAARSHARLSQKELEERSGVSQKTISKIERGDQDGSTQVAQLARACGVSTDWLATEAGEMVPGVGARAEQPGAAYHALSDAAIEIARAWDRLSDTCQDHVRRQIELLRGTEANHSGRRRAVQQDVEIKQGALRPSKRSKARKGVR